MKILSLDSTSPTMSVAITENDRLLSLHTSNTGNTHSETLLPAIENMLGELHLSVEDIDMFAFAAGPGSFTGVRIGASTIKGLAFAQSKPCVEVSELDALAHNLIAFDGILCPVMNARRSQVYNALFSCEDSQIKRFTPDRALSISELEDELAALGSSSIMLCGDGYDLAIKEFKKITPRTTPELLKYSNALSVALCALEAYSQGQYKDDLSVSPVYLRKSQAEREREEKIANKNL